MTAPARAQSDAAIPTPTASHPRVPAVPPSPPHVPFHPLWWQQWLPVPPAHGEEAAADFAAT